jgi:hypothetical protein
LKATDESTHYDSAEYFTFKFFFVIMYLQEDVNATQNNPCDIEHVPYVEIFRKLGRARVLAYHCKNFFYNLENEPESDSFDILSEK